MKSEHRDSIRQKVIDALGNIGYFFCGMQWFWSVLLYFSAIKSAVTFVAPSVSQPVIQPQTHHFTLPGPVEITLFVVIILLMIAITIYAFIKIPSTLVKTGDTVIHRTTRVATPVVMRALHQKDTTKNRIILSTRLVLLAKLLLIIIPLIAAAVSEFLVKQPVDHTVAMAASYTLASLSIIFFIFQYGLAYLLHVKANKIR